MPRETLPGLSAVTEGQPFFPSFQKEMNRLIDQFRSGFPRPDTEGALDFTGPSFPAIDVVDNETSMEISAEVPGVKEDDLDVSITGEVLTLKGEKSSEHEEKEDDYHMIERRYGSFRRKIPLGFRPEADAVKADFKNGVLTLRIAKPASAKTEVQKIDIRKSD